MTHGWDTGWMDEQMIDGEDECYEETEMEEWVEVGL